MCFPGECVGLGGRFAEERHVAETRGQQEHERDVILLAETEARLTAKLREVRQCVTRFAAQHGRVTFCYKQLLLERCNALHWPRLLPKGVSSWLVSCFRWILAKSTCMLLRSPHACSGTTDYSCGWPCQPSKCKSKFKSDCALVFVWPWLDLYCSVIANSSARCHSLSTLGSLLVFVQHPSHITRRAQPPALLPRQGLKCVAAEPINQSLFSS